MTTTSVRDEAQTVARLLREGAVHSMREGSEFAHYPAEMFGWGGLELGYRAADAFRRVTHRGGVR